MKRILNRISLLTILLGLTLCSKAQITGGLKIGVSTGSVRIDEIESGFTDVIQGKNIMGVEAGGFLQLKGGAFYVRPEVLYDYRNGDAQFNEGDAEHFTNITIHKLQVPLIGGFKLIGPVSIEGGPVYNFLFSATEQYGGNNLGFGKSGMGYRAGAALNFDRIILNVSYQGMTRYNDAGNARLNEPFKLVFGLGFGFGGGKDK